MFSLYLNNQYPFSDTFLSSMLFRHFETVADSIFKGQVHDLKFEYLLVVNFYLYHYNNSFFEFAPFYGLNTRYDFSCYVLMSSSNWATFENRVLTTSFSCFFIRISIALPWFVLGTIFYTNMVFNILMTCTIIQIFGLLDVALIISRQHCR